MLADLNLCMFTSAPIEPRKCWVLLKYRLEKRNTFVEHTFQLFWNNNRLGNRSTGTKLLLNLCSLLTGKPIRTVCFKDGRQHVSLYKATLPESILSRFQNTSLALSISLNRYSCAETIHFIQHAKLNYVAKRNIHKVCIYLTFNLCNTCKTFL